MFFLEYIERFDASSLSAWCRVRMTRPVGRWPTYHEDNRDAIWSAEGGWRDPLSTDYYNMDNVAIWTNPLIDHGPIGFLNIYNIIGTSAISLEPRGIIKRSRYIPIEIIKMSRRHKHLKIRFWMWTRLIIRFWRGLYIAHPSIRNQNYVRLNDFLIRRHRERNWTGPKSDSADNDW